MRGFTPKVGRYRPPGVGRSGIVTNFIICTEPV
jgi:hypothetical protein